MIARVGLVMATYLAVGLLLAAGVDVRGPVDVTVQAEAGAPVPTFAPAAAVPAVGTDADVPANATDADAPTVAVDSDSLPIVSPTTTSTVAWDSGVLSEARGQGVVPSVIEIPSLDVTAEVVESGIDEVSRQMAIPARADQVGWYRFGPRPGEQGSAVLAGHVDLAGYGPGAFFELDRLAAGDLVIIHMSDGASREFEVVDTTRVPKSELDLAEVFDNTGSARVTLITCGGAFNQTERTYFDNVVSSLQPVRSS